MAQSITESLHGSDMAHRKKAFEECIAEVAERHKDFFINTPSRTALQDQNIPSTIDEFYTWSYFDGVVSLGFDVILPVLPEHIANECRACFEKHFGPNSH